MKIIFLGPQGSGKSTQAEMLAKKLNIPHLEMGELLREKMKENDQDVQAIKNAMETGTLVPNEITIRILNQKLEKPDCAKGFILDGYPRNKQQADNLPEGVDHIVYINIPDEVAIERLFRRARADDTKAVIQKRLDIYHQDTEPLLEHFKQQGILLEIDGLPAIEQVDKDIREKLHL